LGEGELRPKLEALVQTLHLEEAVSLPGYVENLYAFMKHAKVFVLSSAWEGLPTVLIGALACDCLVVSTDCPGGVREILKDGKYGELVKVGDERALAAAIERTLFLKERRVDPQWLIQFSLETVVDETLKLMFHPHGKFEKNGVG
jgi:glycosyltransferase involved in cell wall biosynthesis